MAPTDLISQAVACNLCTGCGACAGLAPDFIRMVEDPVHGRRPVVAAGVAARQAADSAAQACAGLGADHRTLPRQDALDQTWGPVRAVWIGHAADDEIRFRGSSGGAVTALAHFALTSGAVGAVAHTVAAEDPRKTVSTLSRDRAALLRGAGSRYAQASPAEILARLPSDPVLFVGKPCDVASVHKAKAAFGLAARLPLSIAVFCAGAPNQQASDRLLARLGMPDEARPLALRYRGKGWPGLMQARWHTADGQAGQSDGLPYAIGWGQILQAGRRWRCRICTDHTGAFADISVGDPWHTPPKDHCDAGQSLIVARSAAGEALVRAAIAAGVLVARPAPRGAIAESQPNLLAALGAVWGRRLAMRLAGLPVPADQGLPLWREWRALGPRAKAQSVGGTLKRILRNRLWRPVVIGAAK